MVTQTERDRDLGSLWDPAWLGLHSPGTDPPRLKDRGGVISFGALSTSSTHHQLQDVRDEIRYAQMITIQSNSTQFVAAFVYLFGVDGS